MLHLQAVGLKLYLKTTLSEVFARGLAKLAYHPLYVEYQNTY